MITKHLRWYCTSPRSRPMWLRHIESYLHARHSDDRATLEEAPALLAEIEAELHAYLPLLWHPPRAKVTTRIEVDDIRASLIISRGSRPVMILKFE